MSAYRSRYTGREIDGLLSSIDNKIDMSYISNSWEGGTQLAASAELAKSLYQGLQQFNNPNYIRQLLTSIPNSLVFTQAMSDKLDRLAGFFQGSFANASTRNIAVSTIGFVGGELTFLVDDGSGTDTQQLSFWDTVNLAWKPARFLPNPASAAVTYGSASTVVSITFDKTKFTGGKYLIKAESDVSIKVLELLVAVKGSNTFWTVHGEVGDGASLFYVSSISISGSQVRVNLAVTPNITVRFYRLGEF